MAECPNCQFKQKPLKVLALNNFNKIVCPECNSELRVKKSALWFILSFTGVIVGMFAGLVVASDPTSPISWSFLVFSAAVFVFLFLRHTKLYVSN